MSNAALRSRWTSVTHNIPAKPVHNHDIVSVYFNHFYCMEICDKQSGDLAMSTYIYIDVDECSLTSSMLQ